MLSRTPFQFAMTHKPVAPGLPSAACTAGPSLNLLTHRTATVTRGQQASEQTSPEVERTQDASPVNMSTDARWVCMARISSGHLTLSCYAIAEDCTHKLMQYHGGIWYLPARDKALSLRRSSLTHEAHQDHLDEHFAFIVVYQHLPEIGMLIELLKPHANPNRSSRADEERLPSQILLKLGA